MVCLYVLSVHIYVCMSDFLLWMCASQRDNVLEDMYVCWWVVHAECYPSETLVYVISSITLLDSNNTVKRHGTGDLRHTKYSINCRWPNLPWYMKACIKYYYERYLHRIFYSLFRLTERWTLMDIVAKVMYLNMTWIGKLSKVVRKERHENNKPRCCWIHHQLMIHEST